MNRARTTIMGGQTRIPFPIFKEKVSRPLFSIVRAAYQDNQFSAEVFASGLAGIGWRHYPDSVAEKRKPKREPLELHHKEESGEEWGEYEAIPDNLQRYEGNKLTDLEKIIENARVRGSWIEKITTPESLPRMLLVAQELYCAGWYFDRYI